MENQVSLADLPTKDALQNCNIVTEKSPKKGSLYLKKIRIHLTNQTRAGKILIGAIKERRHAFV